MAGLTGTGDDVNFPAVLLNRDEIRRHADIEVPNVMAYILKVPPPFARRGIQRNDAIGEEIVPVPVDAHHVGPRRTKRDENHPAALIERDATPAVGSSLRIIPRLSAEVRALRHGAEAPALRPRAHVVAKDVAIESCGDKHIAVNDARRGGPGGNRRSSTHAERGQQLARPRIERIDEVAGPQKDPRRGLLVPGPVHQTAPRRHVLQATAQPGERPPPAFAAGGSIHPHDRAAGRRHDHEVIDVAVDGLVVDEFRSREERKIRACPVGVVREDQPAMHVDAFRAK